MNAFWAMSALLAAAALFFVVPPLLARRGQARASRRESNLAIYRGQLRELDADLAAGTLTAEQHATARGELEARLLEDVPANEKAPAPVLHGRGAAIVAGIAVPLLAFGLYFAAGNPQALSPNLAEDQTAHGISGQQVEALVERLAARMREDPEHLDGWILLGRSYAALGRFDQAAQSYTNAVTRLPRDAGLLADYADMLAMAQGRRLQGEPEKIIARALEANPGNLKALTLAGSAAFEKKDYAAAIRFWERILPLVSPESETARTIQASIAEARSLGGTADDKRATKAR